MLVDTQKLVAPGRFYFEVFFYRFQPCQLMRKHAFAGQNTQQVFVT